MFGKKLKEEDIAELKRRVRLINDYALIIQALELQNKVYTKNLMPKYGLDMNKNYEADLVTGKIVEAKPKPKPKQ